MPGSLIIQPFANSGDVTTPPQTDPNGFVNFNQGYTPFYEIELASGNPQAKAVERQVQNALFKIATENIQAWQQMGFPEWFSTMPSGYIENATVMREDGFNVWRPYRSLTDGNITDPLASATWEYIPLPSEAIGSIPMPSGGAAGQSAMLVTAATNFNTFDTGTWTIQSDAVAIGSANSPSAAGSTAAAGVLESLTWLNGATPYVSQRYLDRNGNLFFRGASNGVWTAWSPAVPPSDYSVDTSAVGNLVSATFALTSAVLPDNSRYWVKISVTNTGAVTFTPNPGIIPVPLPVVGQAGLPLQGGEIVDGGRALFIYKTDTNNFVLSFCSGGALQVPTASASNQAVNLAQVTSILSGQVDGNSALYQMGLLF